MYNYYYNTFVEGTQVDGSDPENTISESFIEDVLTELGYSEYYKAIYKNLPAGNIQLTKMLNIILLKRRTDRNQTFNQAFKLFATSGGEFVRNYVDRFNDPIFNEVIKRSITLLSLENIIPIISLGALMSGETPTGGGRRGPQSFVTWQRTIRLSVNDNIAALVDEVYNTIGNRI